MSPCDPSMEDLPVSIMVDILSRLPIKTIIHCKCVSKKWRNIVLDPYFADIQLSISTAGFMIYYKDGILKWVEVEDELNHHKLHHDPVMSLDLNLAPTRIIFPLGSVNGLVCMWQPVSPIIDNTYICNPITREYMILANPQYHFERGQASIIYCFGVFGSLKRKYKVIQIFQTHSKFPDSTQKFRLGLSEADVYTLGTGQWRSLGHVPYWFNEHCGQFLNGCGHWTIQDSREKICSFSFDNETFELFPSPPSEATTEERQIYSLRLGVLKGCLCQCDAYTTKLTVWVMKEYGIKNSWHKELVIEKGICPNVKRLLLNSIQHVQGLKDGTILMASSENSLFVYCPRRKAIVKTESVDGFFRFGLAYRPSFSRLQNIENESVHVF